MYFMLVVHITPLDAFAVAYIAGILTNKLIVVFVDLQIGAIVPFNYPFHNIFNPVTAALFSGNACVVKVRSYS